MSQGAAFVVGATGGLGAAICRRLAADWPGLALGYRSSRAKADVLAAALPDALPVHCDLQDQGSIEAAFAAAAARFGRIGTVITASGVAIPQPFVSQIATEAWREVFEVELLGFTRLVAAALPLFRAQGGGNFVTVTSVAVRHYPPGDALSAVPKAGLEMLCRAIAKEEGRYSIRANSVAPGIIDAGLGAAFLTDLYTPAIWAAQKKRIALQRFGTGEDIAEAVAFLASERSSYVTGQTITVDGGFGL